jgi:hypothetical protein
MNEELRLSDIPDKICDIRCKMDEASFLISNLTDDYFAYNKINDKAYQNAAYSARILADYIDDVQNRLKKVQNEAFEISNKLSNAKSFI